MSGKYYFIDKHGNGQTLELVKVSKNEYMRKRSSENPANSERAKKPKPAGTNEVNIRNNLENKLKQIQGLSRFELEKLTRGVLSDLIDQHVNADELLDKLNKKTNELASMKNKYSALENQINQISSTISTIREKFNDLETQTNQIFFIENNVIGTLHKTPIQFSVVQVERDALETFIDLTGEDESTSSNKVTSSEQVAIPENKSVAAEDTALDDEATPETAKEPSSPQKSQKSIVEETVNNQHHTHPAPLPVLPIIYFVEPSSKLMAPAPEIKTHLMRDKVALTWFMLEEDMSAYEEMLIFQVYCYKETSDPPSTTNWKKLVELTALPLPMTCFVGKSNVGKYYFAVRGIDNQLRVGPFSSPVSITFKDGGIMPVARNLNA